MTVPPRSCLRCERILDVVGFYLNDDKTSYLFCSETCRESWEQSDYLTKLACVFGSAERGADLLRRLAGGYHKIERRGPTEWHYKASALKRPLEVCPVNTADGGSCPDCRPWQIAWTQVTVEEVRA